MHNASTLCMKCTICVVTSLILNVECGLEKQKKLIVDILTYLSLHKAAVSCYFYVIFLCVMWSLFLIILEKCFFFSIKRK